MVWAIQHVLKGTNDNALEEGGDAMTVATAGQLLVRTEGKK
jgi:hypothetical protein